MIRVEILRARNMKKESIDIDFNNMVVYVKSVSFNIHRDGKDIWLFSPVSGTTSPKALTLSACCTIEKAYVQWSLEKTILGAQYD